MKKSPSLTRAIRVASLTLILGSCQGSGYTSFLKFGHEDSKLALLDATQENLDNQLEAHEHFISALNLFNRLTRFDSEDLEGLYEDFADEVDDCEGEVKDWQSRALDLRMRGNSLFAEWSAQLESFSRADLREKSASMLEDARARHAKLIVSMEATYSRMEPVMMSLKDYVLFFQHNLNPRAINTLSDTYDGFVDEVLELTSEMEETRGETESYLEALEGRSSTGGDTEPGSSPNPNP